MYAEPHLIRDVSDTALWTAAYRAEESERPDALFRDPYARLLAGEHGREIIRRVTQPAVRFGVVLRTAILDELITKAVATGGYDTVLNLAAGLDTRPYRLDLPGTLRWIEVDLPGLVAYKERVLAEPPAGLAPPVASCALERCALDLTDRSARRALLARTAPASRRTLVITEGLLGYLDADDVAALATDLHAAEGAGGWLTDLIGANMAARVRNAGDDLKAAGARTRFAPAEGTGFFRPFGWVEAEYRDLFHEAPRLGRDSLLGRSLRRLARAVPRLATRLERGMGVVRLRRDVAD